MECKIKRGDRVRCNYYGDDHGMATVQSVSCPDNPALCMVLVAHDNKDESTPWGTSNWFYSPEDLTVVEGAPTPYASENDEWQGDGDFDGIDLRAKDILPTDSKERKALPVATGVLDYFPAAIVEVSRVSKKGNDQHHPGEPLHWERGKSTDHADTMIRHFLQRGTVDTDGTRHSAKMVWRALAILQEELEAEGVQIARGSFPSNK